MLTTFDAKRIGRILYMSGPKTFKRLDVVLRQLTSLDDSLHVDFFSVYGYLQSLYLNHLEKRSLFFAQVENPKCSCDLHITKNYLSVDEARDAGNKLAKKYNIDASSVFVYNLCRQLQS